MTVNVGTFSLESKSMEDRLKELVNIHNGFHYKQANPINLRALIACDEEINNILQEHPELGPIDLIKFELNK